MLRGGGRGGVGSLKSVGAREADVGERSHRAIEDHARVIEDFLKLSGGSSAMAFGKIGFGASLDGEKANVGRKVEDAAEIDRGCGLEFG
jgi:hypothetical protein